MSERTFSNWGGTVRFAPAHIATPATEEELSTLVVRAAREGRCVRPVGAAHSWPALVETNDVLVSLDRMQGLVAVEGMEATVWAGTRLKKLGELLHARGLAMENLGDIDVQSIAGATSTGTHGTGSNFRSIANQITGLRVMLADGSILNCNAHERPELLNALRVALGAMGIITQITLRCVPTYRLKFTSGKETLDSCLGNLQRYDRETRNFEFYCFPYSDKVQMKFIHLTEEEPTGSKVWSYINDVVLENSVFGAFCGVAKNFPSTIPAISKLTAAVAGGGTKVDHAHRIFATVRTVRFNEMEYSIPVQHLPEAITRIQALIREERIPVNFPIECRSVKGDELWLSPAHGRDSAYIAVHMYKGMPHKDYFLRVETLLRSYGGRPHWGKLHTLTASELKDIYPRWNDFIALREQLDPQGVFLNGYLKRLLLG
ncbi:MAG: D-arabinono-1,4-lactone oxidase [Flavobacteriales bacterium]